MKPHARAPQSLEGPSWPASPTLSWTSGPWRFCLLFWACIAETFFFLFCHSPHKPTSPSSVISFSNKNSLCGIFFCERNFCDNHRINYLEKQRRARGNMRGERCEAKIINSPKLQIVTEGVSQGEQGHTHRIIQGIRGTGTGKGMACLASNMVQWQPWSTGPVRYINS